VISNFYTLLRTSKSPPKDSRKSVTLEQIHQGKHKQQGKLFTVPAIKQLQAQALMKETKVPSIYLRPSVA
jgi:hypothetical protein